LSPHPQDDAFHEIQLNGKQLVFLFMAATVVSVVIFLCGVLVGRGVRAERALAMADAGLTAPADTTPQQPAATPTPAPAGSDPTAASPPPAVDDLSYFNRLEKPSPAPEQLKAPPSRATASAPEQPAPAASKPPAVAPPPTPPDGEGWAVQIAALNARGDAEAVAKQMSSKGYTAYVVAPATGTSVYRVRIGTFKTKHEAEAMAAKLQKEEQFKPWVTR
jgi:cell division septation protein DedD